MRRRRALSSEDARKVRQTGYDDALEFALSIGLTSDYKNDRQAKKDVIDRSGDSHSVKGGRKKWQVFLYGRERFKSDYAWDSMNGIGALLVECIDSFPPTYKEYQRDKDAAKQRLRIPMVKLAERLQNPNLLRAFISKSLFNSGEVGYLTAKHDGVFHVFLNKDVVEMLGSCLEVCNSKALSASNTPEQKVLFRYNGLNLGELEMRNDSPIHYREIRFNMVKPRVMEALFTNIPLTNKYSNKVLVYGNATKRFGRWDK